MNDHENSKMMFVLIILIVMFLFGFLTYTFFFKVDNKMNETPVYDPEAGLGMPGAICGGELRLPCMPGNTCQIINIELNEGVCVHITDNPGLIQPPERSDI